MRAGEQAGSAGSERARYRRILRFAMVQLAIQWWYELFLPRIGLARFAGRSRARRMTHFAHGFRELAIGLGGLMIKVGQFMSSRLDVLPPELTKELEDLQDVVPAEDFADIRRLAEAELGTTLERAFAWIDETPVAAASLGQAHRARLSDVDAANVGFAEVVLKVQRPGIDRLVEVDLAALRRVAAWLSHVRIVANKVDAPGLVEEFSAISRREIDYLAEAENAERFAQIFADNPRVTVPEVVWERATRRVLTLEDVSAIKISDVPALRAVGIDSAEVAPVFAEIMFDQLFTAGFFHADPHPGNLFVTPSGAGSSGEAADWRLTFIDFGMMGEVPTAMKSGLRRLVIAMATRDSRGLVEAAREIGVLLPSADTVELEKALGALFARFGGMGFAELREVDEREFRAFGDEFGEVVRDLPIQLPENFLLIVRAGSMTSGVSTTLDPTFNIWDSLEPYAASLVKDQSGGLVKDLAHEGVDIARIVWGLPKRVDSVLDRLDAGNLAISSPQVEKRLVRVEAGLRRAISAVLCAGLLISGAILYPHAEVVGIVAMSLAAVPLLHVLFAPRR